MDDDNLSRPTLHIDLNAGSVNSTANLFNLQRDFDARGACERLSSRASQTEKYTIQKKIAEGGMGSIYQVIDGDLKRPIVLKVMHPKIMENQQMFISFIEEARITGRLEHPNIIPVHDLGVIDEDKLYFSMKEVQGVGLNSILARIRRGDEETCQKYTLFTLLTLFRKVCDAVAYAHSKNFIHRDIKPENIMVGDYGEVLLVDWGLARQVDKPDPEIQDIELEDVDTLAEAIGNRTKTQYGIVKGTPAFMSPEQARGVTEEIDMRSDIFLLGATLYSIATLTLPFQGVDVYDILDNAEVGNIQHPQDRAPQRELPVELCRIIMKGMAHKPQDRYQSVKEMIQDLDDLLEGRTVSEQQIYQPGEFLIREGDVGKEAYVIISGEVEVFQTVDGGRLPLVRLREGASIGEMAIISKERRSASVVAITETHVVVITEDIIKNGLDKMPPWLGHVVHALVNRLRDTNVNMHPLFNSDCTYHVLNQLRMIYLCYGTPAMDSYNDKPVITLSIEKALKEISMNLCINLKRVTQVVSKLMETGLIDSLDYNHLSIPNFTLFCQFLEYVGDQLGFESPYDSFPQVSFLSNNSQYLVQYPLENEANEESELRTIEPRGVDEILGCNSGEELLGVFEEILGALQENFSV